MLWNRLTSVLGPAVLILFLVSAYTPVWNGIASALAEPAVIESADAIVVLSASLLGNKTLTAESLRRAFHGIGLYRRGLAPLIILSGRERVSPPTEAEIRARLARDMGIQADAILLEETANTTREESMRIGELLLSRNARRILLVTQSLHMRRAKLVFERAGFHVLPAPSDQYPKIASGPAGRFWLMFRVLQETVGLLYYRSAGYI